MPVNHSESICLGCGAAPGMRHAASCSEASELNIYPGDGKAAAPPLMREGDRATMPTSLAERQVKAMESIAMSLDAMARHLLTPGRGPTPPRSDQGLPEERS